MADEDKMSDDELMRSMFDEIEEVTVKDGKVVERKLWMNEQTVVQTDAQEMKNAVADCVRSWREFSWLDQHLATDYGRQGIEWWRALESLALSDSRLKQAFCGHDRSPASIRQFHKWRLKLIECKRYRTDA
jgi:hypothetical protein